MMQFEEWLQRLLQPDHGASEPLRPNGQKGKKYAFGDIEGSAKELLQGTIMALPNARFLKGVDLGDDKAVLAEIQKAWVGGYVTGRTWAFLKVESLLFQECMEDGQLIDALAEYNWAENAPQQDLLATFNDFAMRLRNLRAITSVRNTC